MKAKSCAQCNKLSTCLVARRVFTSAKNAFKLTDTLKGTENALMRDLLKTISRRCTGFDENSDISPPKRLSKDS
jgi:hypothetical protein